MQLASSNGVIFRDQRTTTHCERPGASAQGPRWRGAPGQLESQCAQEWGRAIAGSGTTESCEPEGWRTSTRPSDGLWSSGRVGGHYWASGCVAAPLQGSLSRLTNYKSSLHTTAPIAIADSHRFWILGARDRLRARCRKSVPAGGRVWLSRTRIDARSTVFRRGPSARATDSDDR